jgi:hypothetical protein
VVDLAEEVMVNAFMVLFLENILAYIVALEIKLSYL